MNKLPRVLVCGGRNFNNREKLFRIMGELCDKYGWITEPSDDGNYLPRVHVISGKARGADTLAIDWAVTNWCEFTEYPAEWDKYGKSAGYKRNTQMLVEGKPDYVVAFPGGAGTRMMVTIAKKAGVPVIEIE